MKSKELSADLRNQTVLGSGHRSVQAYKTISGVWSVPWSALTSATVERNKWNQSGSALPGFDREDKLNNQVRRVLIRGVTSKSFSLQRWKKLKKG